MSFDRKLRLIRESLGLSQAALGKSIGLSGAYIFRLENGKANISEEVIKKYITSFGLDPEWMRSEDDEEIIYQKPEGFASVGNRIKELRLDKGLSQRAFAKYAGVQPSDISRAESGKTSLGPQTLTRIAEAFHVGIEWLRYGDESKKTYPVDEKVIEYLWGHENLREMIYQYMNEDAGKE